MPPHKPTDSEKNLSSLDVVIDGTTEQSKADEKSPYAAAEAIEAALYDPPLVDKAVAFMRDLQPRDKENPGPDGHGGQYKIFTTDFKMAWLFGDGLSFWFILLRTYAGLFAVFVLSFAYFYEMCRRSNMENGTSSAELSDYARTSLGAVLFFMHEKDRGGAVTDKDRDDALGIVMNDAICMACMVSCTLYLLWLKSKLKDKNDQEMITMEDYTMKVYGLPPDVDEERVKAHFGRFGELHDIALGKDLKELMDMRRKLLSLKIDSPKRAELMAKMKKAKEKGQKVVSAFVVYAEEKGRFDCSHEVSKSIREWNKDLNPLKVMESSDVRMFEGKHALEITSADPPSDILWENLHYNRKGLPLRRFFSNILMALFIIFQFAIIAYVRDSTDRVLNPIPQCSNIAADGEYLDCPAIWNLQNQTEHDQAKEDIIPFIKQDVNRKQCNRFTMNGEWVTDMHAYYGFNNGSSEVNATEWRANQTATDTYLGGFDSTTLADECAAHLCYACFCDATFVAEKQKGGGEAKFDGQGGFREGRGPPGGGRGGCRKLLGHDGDDDGPPSGGGCGPSGGQQGGGDQQQQGGGEQQQQGGGGQQQQGGGDQQQQGGGDQQQQGGGGQQQQGGGGQQQQGGGGQGPPPGGRRRLLERKRKLLERKLKRNLLGHDGDNDGPGGSGGPGGPGDGPGGPGGPGDGPDGPEDDVTFSSFLEDPDLEDDICSEYDRDQFKSQYLSIVIVTTTALMNNIIQFMAKALSEFERPHSFSALERSISSKLSVSLVVNMVIFPLLLSASIKDLQNIPLMFDGDHEDINRTWYQDFCNKFSQVAMVNSISFPATAIIPVVVYFFKRKITAGWAKTQLQLNETYRPPVYNLSQRSAVYTAALVYSLMFSSGIPLVYVYLVFMSIGFLIADRIALVGFCQIPPRYTGKICAFVLNSVPLAVILHFMIAVFTFGQRDFPSYVLEGGESGAWADYGTTLVTDDQADIEARILRVNGFIPFMGFLITSSCALLFYTLKLLKRIHEKRMGKDDEVMEGAPPVLEAMAQEKIAGLPSYRITDHPAYKHLFPPGSMVTKGLNKE